MIRLQWRDDMLPEKEAERSPLKENFLRKYIQMIASQLKKRSLSVEKAFDFFDKNHNGIMG